MLFWKYQLHLSLVNLKAEKHMCTLGQWCVHWGSVYSGAVCDNDSASIVRSEKETKPMVIWKYASNAKKNKEYWPAESMSVVEDGIKVVVVGETGKRVKWVAWKVQKRIMKKKTVMIIITKKTIA